jgi:O-antigen/teichoic acid export membrane protein
MGLFGSEFVVGATILITLSIGQFIHVSCGSVGYILSMTGHEKLFRNVILVSAAINIILSTLLVQLYGSLGVAMATAFSLSLWNILALYLIRKKLGFWPLYLITYKK